MCLVSIIVPTYKRPNKLNFALKSILDQTYKNIEVVLVDDNGLGSEYDEETRLVAQEFNAKFDKFVFVKNEYNMGGGGARNEGIKASSGEYITFLDDDDEFVSNKIELQVKKFSESEYSNLAFVYCQMTVFDEITRIQLSKTKNYYSGNRLPFEKNMQGCIAGTPSILAKKSSLQKVKGFRDLKSGQDWALILDLLVAGFEIEYMPESLVNVYASSTGRISNSLGKIESLEGELKEIKDEIVLGLRDKKLIKKVYYHHYFQLASALKFKSKTRSLYYYSKTISYGFETIDSAKFLFGLLFGEKLSNNIKGFLSKINI